MLLQNNMFKNLTYIAIFTFIIILSWIGFGVYHSYATSTIGNDTQVLISPIPAHFDLDVVKQISERKIINADLAANSPTASGSTKLTPSPAPTINPVQISPTISPLPTEPQSSESANIQL